MEVYYPVIGNRGKNMPFFAYMNFSSCGAPNFHGHFCRNARTVFQTQLLAQIKKEERSALPHVVNKVTVCLFVLVIDQMIAGFISKSKMFRSNPAAYAVIAQMEPCRNSRAPFGSKRNSIFCFLYSF
jgi:hypothetical protein